MVFAAVFAGGIGSRMGNSETPKQYLELGTKPVIIHTIEKFFINETIDEIIVLCPKAWVAHTRDLIKKHIPEGKKITVIAGGETRNGTLEKAIEFIETNYETDEDTVILPGDFSWAMKLEESIKEIIKEKVNNDNIKTVSE